MRPAAIFLLLCTALPAQTGVTPVVTGSLRVVGNHLVDSAGHSIVLKGTEMSADPGAGLTSTTFSTINLRWNMNALRLLVSPRSFIQDRDYVSRISEAVRKANQVGLEVILAARDQSATGLPSGETAAFWKICAAYFKSYPMVVFDVFDSPRASYVPGHVPGRHSAADWQFWLRGGVATNGQQAAGMQALVDAIRSTGAEQVIAVAGFVDAPHMQGFDAQAFIRDPNIALVVQPQIANEASDEERHANFGFLASRFPLIASNWGIALQDDSAACRALPTDPEDVDELIYGMLAYFEERNISWTASSFEPNKLIWDFKTYEATHLDAGWTCGQTRHPPAGIGEAVQYFLWGITESSLAPVNGGSGGIAVAQGGIVVAYGPDIASATASARGVPPTTLAGIRVEIKDSAGALHFAPLLHVSPGQVNFLIPPATACGVAKVRVLNESGSGPKGVTLVQKIAPGLLTESANARGAAIGVAVQRSANGREKSFAISKCLQWPCETVPIPLARGVSTQVTLFGCGFRHARSIASLRVTIGDVSVPIVSFGPQKEVPWNDQVTIRLLPRLRGMGETDLILTVDGQISNVVRIQVL